MPESVGPSAGGRDRVAEHAIRCNSYEGTRCPSCSSMDLRGSIKNLLDVCILADIVIDSVNENPYMIESIILVVCGKKCDRLGSRPRVAPCCNELGQKSGQWRRRPGRTALDLQRSLILVSARYLIGTSKSAIRFGAFEWPRGRCRCHPQWVGQSMANADDPRIARCIGLGADPVIPDTASHQGCRIHRTSERLANDISTRSGEASRCNARRR